MNNKISVIMSVYKENKTELTQSIESILNQTYSNFEYIIILDNPEDEWRENYIKNIDDDRIVFIKNEKNIGLPRSLNKGIEISSGEYIARMDADDISEIHRFEKQLRYLKEKDIDLCGSNVILFYPGEKEKKCKLPEQDIDIDKTLQRRNCVAHPTWLAKREVFIKNNGYRDIHTCEDYDFLIRAKKNKFKVGNIQDFLLKYRYNFKSISRSNPGKQMAIATYLSKKYRKGEIVTDEELGNYLNSRKFNKQKRRCDSYSELKNDIKQGKKVCLLGLVRYPDLVVKDLFIKK